MLKLSQHQKLLQKLSPQQVQYLKLLQLPVIALEQRIKAELEQNPLLEEGIDEEMELLQEEPVDEPPTVVEETDELKAEPEDDKYSIEDFMNDELDGYKSFYSSSEEDEKKEDLPIPAQVPLSEKLLEQIRLLDITDEELQLAEEIIGNIDEDGYLRRPLQNILDDLNLSRNLNLTIEQAEKILYQIQRLDPPGIAARDLRECLLAQLDVMENDKKLISYAQKILLEQYENFTMKHYDQLAKHLNITQEQLKQVLELIQKLNPKPGEGQFTPQENYIVPDFIVEHDGDDIIITLNERNVPPLRINKNYKELISRKKGKGIPPETKEFIRKRFEAAKWFIASIHQRRDTLMKVMRAIVEKQREFFDTGEKLKPMIYKDIAETIGMDISTISRVVNGKYVQTEYGVYELKYFFSDKISTVDGEDISNKEVKKKIKFIIENEPPDKPYSDDEISKMLKEEGLIVARRTVAKYREQMRIPIARLRRKI
ncbi:MAG: RNA polymerase sigma-54 factor RpoN [Ignavibacteriae bacterium]|nr:MAG: RNA polymerase sigma-54 factor RpoN [Ignavibacteriota bacterium]